MGPVATAVVCDVGGGAGYPLRLLASDAGPPGRTHVLAEPQRGMLNRARRHRRFAGSVGLAGVLADGDALPFPDSSADQVLSLGVLCCTAPSSVPRAVRQIHRALRSKGRLAFAVPLRHSHALERLLRSEGFEVLERFGRNRILFAKV